MSDRDLAVLTILALGAVAMMPEALLSNAWAVGAYFACDTAECGPAFGLAGAYHSAVYGVAAGLAVGGPPGALVGAGVSFTISA